MNRSGPRSSILTGSPEEDVRVGARVSTVLVRDRGGRRTGLGGVLRLLIIR